MVSGLWHGLRGRSLASVSYQCKASFLIASLISRARFPHLRRIPRRIQSRFRSRRAWRQAKRNRTQNDLGGNGGVVP
jgi:hypothetical protein